MDISSYFLFKDSGWVEDLGSICYVLASGEKDALTVFN
jgi:hypothetical protein